MIRRLSLLLFAVLALFLLGAGAASASPGHYRVLIVWNDEEPSEFAAELAQFADVSTVDLFEETEAGLTPTQAELESYDLVVLANDDDWADPAALGDNLAGFADSGGAVVEFAYSNWDDENAEPGGRFASQGYAPFLSGPNPNDPVSLGDHDSSSPLLEGVNELESSDNTDNELAPGATSIAKWSDGRQAIAFKGRVLSASAFMGDETWAGDFPRLVVNAARVFDPIPPPPPTSHSLAVINSNPVGGTVTSSLGGLSCGALCSTRLPIGSAVTLAATPVKGFAFGGFSGACTGPACALTLDADKSVGVSFVSFSRLKKVALNRKKGTGTLKVTLGSAGTLVLSGKKLKKQSKATKAAGTLKIPLRAKGAAKRALASKGKAKVSYELTFTPAGGVVAKAPGKTTLKLAG